MINKMNYFLILGLTLLFGCGGHSEHDNKEVVIVDKAINTVLVLDLSDRILESQTDRDKKVLKTVYKNVLSDYLKNSRKKKLLSWQNLLKRAE